MHLEGGRARGYRGGYSSFESQRSERLARERATYEKQQRRAREIRAFVTRFGAKATKARQARSRMKELEAAGPHRPRPTPIPPTGFHFRIRRKCRDPLLHIEDASLGYGGSPVLAGVRLTLRPGARIGLLGRNGAGKSTLLRSIAGELPLVAGRCERGRNAPVGYFAQRTMETLVPTMSPMEHLAGAEPEATDQAIRNYVGGWGFSGDAAFGRSALLSGGEKARLALALIAWRKPAVLLLDEPTNHLDLDMRHALTVALQSYGGALVIVSHDRHLLGSTVDDLLLVADGRVTPYDGTLDDYRDWLLGRDDASPPAESRLGSRYRGRGGAAPARMPARA